FRPEAEGYPIVLTRFEGVELMNHSPFIYAFEETNVGLTGAGTLDGQANAQQWWIWRTNQAPSRTKLIQMAADGVPPEERVFGDGPSKLRRNFIQPYRCQNVLIEKCTSDTGAHCLALKSGRNDDVRRLHTPIENVIIRDCDMTDGHGGV